MTVDCDITQDDLIAFNLYHHRHSPSARKQYYRLWFIPALVWLLLCAAMWYFAIRDGSTPLRTFLALLPLFSGVPLYLIYFPWAHRRNLRKTVARLASEGQNRGLFGRHRIAISPENITESGEFGQGSTSWRAVERVVATTDHLFVYINALAAIIVPRRAFRGASEFEEFVRAARSYHHNAMF